jgi:CheY-like chemotaxis protein
MNKLGDNMARKTLKKILVAEDEPDIQAVLQIALEDVGEFNIKICSSGLEVLKNIDAFEPDLILLDMMMPHMDGLTTLSEIRKLPRFNKVPVIFVTAKSQNSEIAHYMQLGAQNVITKPFDPMTLSDKLHEIWNSIDG